MKQAECFESRMIRLKSQIKKSRNLYSATDVVAAGLKGNALANKVAGHFSSMNQPGGITKTIQDVISKINNVTYADIKKQAEDALGQANEFFASLTKQASSKAKDGVVMSKAYIEKIKGFAKIIKGYYDSIMKGIEEMLPTTGIKCAMVGLMVLAVLLFIMEATGADQEVGKFVGQFMDSLKGVFGDLADGIKDIFSNMNNLKELGKAVIGLITSVFATPFKILASLAQAIVDTPNSAIMILGLILLGFGICVELRIYYKGASLPFNG